MDKENINVVTCSVWVPRGAAKQNPDKVEVSKEELAKIIKETSDNLAELDIKEVQEDDYTSLELEALAKDMKIDTAKPKALSSEAEMMDADEEIKTEEKENLEKTERDDIEEKYNFDSYNKENEGESNNMFKLGMLAMHADNKDDPNVIVKEDDSDSEKENIKILPSDNLIAVGHVEGDAAILEVYVYNSKESSLYIHHDILLPAVPLCMEWLNLDPEAQNLRPGNLVATGSMSPVIEVWDLDVIDGLEPSYRLGRRPNKKKKLGRLGHSDAVLSLAWNTDLEHILASGSADNSVILWDLQTCQESQKLTSFSNRVQDLKWNPNPDKSHYLLAGSSDKYVRLFDFKNEDQGKEWKLDGEVECLVWDSIASSNNFFAGTDKGTVYCFDIRQDKPVQKFQAHSCTCTGMTLNPECPGCLVTVSEDTTVKIWDAVGPKAELVEENQPNLGIIHTVSSSVDNPFVLSLCGNNKTNNFKVWDIRSSKNVRTAFYDRLGLPIEDDEENVKLTAKKTKNSIQSDFETGGCVTAASVNDMSGWQPKKKSGKKKGGRLDRKKKKK